MNTVALYLRKSRDEDFETKEETYNFAVNHIHGIKLVCGDVYIPYEIIEVKEQKN